MAVRLTKRVVDRLLATPPAGSDAFEWDTDVRGFGVRIKPSGSASFLIQYRNGSGSTRRMVIGAAGTLTPDEARKIARDRLAEVARGIDPSVERRAARDAMTVNELCDWYLEQARKGKLIGRNNRPIKASTLEMDRSRIDTHVRPLIGTKIADKLTVHDMEAMQAKIAAGKTAKPRKSTGRGGVSTGGSAVAGRTLGMMHSIFAHGVHGKQIKMNPAAGGKKLNGKRRKRRLTLQNIAALGEALRAAQADQVNATALRAIRALLLTGFRRMEVMTMRAEWVGSTPAGGYVNFPDTKTETQVRPVGKSALSALKAAKGDEWVFPAHRGDGHFVGVVKILDQVATRAKLQNVTPHVLRHTFASVAGDLGYSKLTIAGLLGHTSSGDTESYVHLDTSLLAAANRVSSLISLTLDGADIATITNLFPNGEQSARLG